MKKSTGISWSIGRNQRIQRFTKISKIMQLMHWWIYKKLQVFTYPHEIAKQGQNLCRHIHCGRVREFLFHVLKAAWRVDTTRITTSNSTKVQFAGGGDSHLWHSLVLSQPCLFPPQSCDPGNGRRKTRWHGEQYIVTISVFLGRNGLMNLLVSEPGG